MTDDQICKDLNAHVATNIAKFAVPSGLVIVPGLPKTRSGKNFQSDLKYNIYRVDKKNHTSG